MIVNLSKEAKHQVVATAKRANVNPETYVKSLLEQIFKPNTMYLILNPIPQAERLNALKVALEGIMNMPEFFGFRFLTKDEATQESAAYSKFAWCNNCGEVQTVSFEGFVNRDVAKKYMGGDLVCQKCYSICAVLCRPMTPLEVAMDLTKPAKKEVISFPRAFGGEKPAEELLLYDYGVTFRGVTPAGKGWVISHVDKDVDATYWRRLHTCKVEKDIRCDVCGRLG